VDACLTRMQALQGEYAQELAAAQSEWEQIAEA
jgi:hypothetical protein